MGLDITAMRHARLFAKDLSPEALDVLGRGPGPTPQFCYRNTAFEEQADGLETGFYECDEALDFRAGPYGHYNRWREKLCLVMLGVEPEEVWRNPDAFKGKPFVDLINFADNEGIIGPATAGYLLADFQTHSGLAAEQDEWFVTLYGRFCQAFELAADDGLVSFH